MNIIKKWLHATPNDHLRHSVDALFLLIIVLQVADALSTFWALQTGEAHEQNKLLVVIAHASRVDVMWIVVAAKLVVASSFILAMKKCKSTWVNLFILLGMALFYIHIVSNNITLTWKILERQLGY